MKKKYFAPAVEVSVLLASTILSGSDSATYDEKGNPLTPSGGNNQEKSSEASGPNLAKQMTTVFTFD